MRGAIRIERAQVRRSDRNRKNHDRQEREKRGLLRFQKDGDDSDHQCAHDQLEREMCEKIEEIVVFSEE